jgi:hypothetical protein
MSLCAAAYAQNASTAAPNWLASALYDSPVKIAANLPAESGVNFTLAPFAGYTNAGSGNSAQEFTGSSGSIAFPIGHSFGLWTDFTAASLGGNDLYDFTSNFYWRAPNSGLIGALGNVGELTGSNGFKYDMGAANAEGYFGRATLFAVGGAFHIQGLRTDGLGMIGAAYYPTDNLQFTLSGYDFGGISGAQAGVEYLLPKPAASPLAMTIGADGYVGNHGTSGAMARLRFLTGANGPNNKTLIERSREDDPISDGMLKAMLDENFQSKDDQEAHGLSFRPQGGICLPIHSSCSHNSQCCNGVCSANQCN